MLVVLSFCAMEAVAWLTHRYVMHGLLWTLHRDHHQKEDGLFERNDAFFLIFALPCILLFWVGATGHKPWMIFIAIGIFLYGMAYFIVHDVIIHQRFRWLSRSDNTYIRAIRWAHKMHHKHLGPENGESFGMLFVARKYWQKVLNDKARMRRQGAT
jgi:beta-carotene 3-hydroxylase